MSSVLSARLRLRYPNAFVLEANLHIQDTVILTGASGAGKTSLLRAIAGLPTPAELPGGEREIEAQLGERLLEGKGKRIPVHARGIGYVFQDSRLLPHLSVAANLDYAARRSPDPKRARSLRERIAEQTFCAHLLDRKPQELSGGEQQRVALARTLSQLPEILLLDEPFSALDAKLRRELIDSLSGLIAELNIPVILVSHHIDELVRLSDRLLLLDGGKLAAEQSLRNFLAESRSAASEAKGSQTLLSCVISGHSQEDNLTELRHPSASFLVLGIRGKVGESCDLRIPARDVMVSRRPLSSSALNQVETTLVDVHSGPPGLTRLSLRLPGDFILLAEISARRFQELGAHPGEQLWAQISDISLEDG